MQPTDPKFAKILLEDPIVEATIQAHIQSNGISPPAFQDSESSIGRERFNENHGRYPLTAIESIQISTTSQDNGHIIRTDRSGI